MQGEEIISVIKEYLQSTDANYAIMIDGDWGTGKTYFFTHSIVPIIEKFAVKHVERKKYGYVSLYGLEKTEEISMELLYQYFGRGKRNAIKRFDKASEAVCEIIESILDGFKLLKLNLLKLKKLLYSVDIKDWIICFDDFERSNLSVNQILGYINTLVEHNRCKVIILANEKEIGKIKLSEKVEEKYDVILSGRKLSLNNNDNIDTNAELDANRLKELSRQVFGEDVLYQSIREKVIGITIKYTPQLSCTFDNVVEGFDDWNGIKDYICEKKNDIINYFAINKCVNLRTLIYIILKIKRLCEKMFQYNRDLYSYDGIMNEFIKYIVYFTIYYKRGGDINKINFRGERGAVYFIKGSMETVKGYRFLQEFCITSYFPDNDFKKIISEYNPQSYSNKKKNSRFRARYNTKILLEMGKWWEKEDKEVERFIEKVHCELEKNRIMPEDYQQVIANLLLIQKRGFDVGDINKVISRMNTNIKNTDNVCIERLGISFNDEEVQKEYDHYIDMLILQGENTEKDDDIHLDEILKCEDDKDWAAGLARYCDEHVLYIKSRKSLMDMIDINVLVTRLNDASTKEWYEIQKMLRSVYISNDLYITAVNDKLQLVKLCQKLDEMQVEGINKTIAKQELEQQLKYIISKM